MYAEAYFYKLFIINYNFFSSYFFSYCFVSWLYVFFLYFTYPCCHFGSRGSIALSESIMAPNGVSNNFSDTRYYFNFVNFLHDSDIF